MTWAFLDDHANENDKLIAVGGAAAWYWACSLMYCRRREAERRQRGERLDFIPAPKALVLYADSKARQHVKRLVEHGLWESVDGGYLVHDYAKVYGQPIASQLDQPNSSRPTPSQLGGKARAGTALRGPAGRFQPAQLRARQDPDPTPVYSDPVDAKDLRALPLAHEAGPADDDGGNSQNPEPRATRCPLDLVSKAERLGVLTELAQWGGVPVETVRAAAEEFVGHWTIGAGFGRVESNWMGKLRGRIRLLKTEGRLVNFDPASQRNSVQPASDSEGTLLTDETADDWKRKANEKHAASKGAA